MRPVRQKVVNPASDDVCSPISIDTRALPPATADDATPPPADWDSQFPRSEQFAPSIQAQAPSPRNGHVPPLPPTYDDAPPPSADWEPQFLRSEQFDPLPSRHKPRRPATGMPRSRPSRTAGPIIRQGTAYTPYERSRAPATKHMPPPSERKHAAPPVRLTPLKTRPFPSPTGHLPVPQQPAVNSAPNEASNPNPAASGHGSVPPTTRPLPIRHGSARRPDNRVWFEPKESNGCNPHMQPGRPYSRSG